ncbi:hypothetical protein SprV_0602100600 [Sparganum proliferum]
MCSWSQRTIPENATGDITLEVPISDSFKRGYLGHENFWIIYALEERWCSYNEGYFRCPYTKHDDYDATRITLPDVEKISYVMLESQYPITIHKSGDESFPGFYAKEGTALDICTDNKKYVLLEWFFNGEEANLQDMSCYRDGSPACRGLRPPNAPNDERCDSPEATPSPVTTKAMMNETANSGARSFMDAAGLILFNLWVFLV